VDILKGIDLFIPRASCGHHGRFRQREKYPAGIAGGLDSPTTGSHRARCAKKLPDWRKTLVVGPRAQDGFVFQSYQLIPPLRRRKTFYCRTNSSAATTEMAAENARASCWLSRLTTDGPLSGTALGRRTATVALRPGVHGEAADLDGRRANGNLDSANGAHILELLIRLNAEQERHWCW
jgi:predicted ABC-type transport system involved in lysophospholipase L1 biosynthesis ATPase subunit